MARKGGNPEISKHGFKKGDPRINRKGAPKKLPLQKELMKAMFGISADEDLTKSQIAAVVRALIEETQSKKIGAQRVAAAKEILERVFGKVKPVIDEEEAKPIIWNETKTYKKGN